MAPPRFDINDPYLMTLEKKKKLQKLPEHYPLVAWRSMILTDSVAGR